MKKILVLLLILFAVQAQAAGIYTTVARGTVTQANMKISAVDRTAFVDFSAADVLTSKLGHLLRIRDSSGRAIQGFIKAAGTGETEGDEEITTWNNDFLGYDTLTVNVNGHDLDSIISDGTGVSMAYTNNCLTVGELYKIVTDITLTSGTSPLFRTKRSIASPNQRIISNIIDNTQYWTASVYSVTNAADNGFRFENTDGSAVNASLQISVKQVLTPSATGVTIVSTKGGSTFNWATKNSAFNYNDPSGYTYEVIQVRQAVLMDSDACLNANATINLTNGSATWACAGIDDSAFQDGKHMITVSDATGKTVLGYYENAGSGDVVNTKSGSTNNWIWKDASFSTAGDYTRKIYYVGD